MNKRMHELALQSKIEFTLDPTETPMRAFAECWEDELEKFAELIVEECCQVLGKETIRHDGYGYNQHALYQKIREHFGVEQ